MNFSTKLKSWFKKDWNETKTLFRCLPAIPFAILCVTMIAMNFLANKGIDFITLFGENIGGFISNIFSADSAIIISWIGFLAGDMIVKIFGTKAAIKVNLTAIGVQLLAILMFTAGALIPGSYWNSMGDATATFNELFLVQFWPCLAGTMAFALATVVDSIFSGFLLKKFKNRTSFKSYAVASYVSTALGQFLDNMLFGLFFSIWQGWFTQTNSLGDILVHLVGFSAIGMIVELIGQCILSPFGFKLTKSWREDNIGKEYIDLVEEAQEVNMTDAVIVKQPFTLKKLIFSLMSIVSLLGGMALAVWNRITNCTLIPEEGLLIRTPLANNIIVVVYSLAIISFIFYIAASAVKSKKNS